MKQSYINLETSADNTDGNNNYLGLDGSNKLSPEDRTVHDWYRFVLSFPPHLVRSYIERFNLSTASTVLDPFCGTGTTVVECKKLNIPSVGVEANPLAHFASRVKVDWSPDPGGLIEHSQRVAKETTAVLVSEGIEDDPVLRGWQLQSTLSGTLRRLDPDVTELLLANSISKLPLHKTLTLLSCLEETCEEDYYYHQLLAIAKALVSPISNLYFGPEVGVGKAKLDAPVVSPWLAKVHTMAEDLNRVRELRGVPSAIFCADARHLANVLEPSSIDAVITSPPYPNEKDYTRTTRLESVLLGFIRSRDDLKALKRNLLRSNTRGVYKGDDDDKLIAEHPEIQRIAEAIEARRLELGKTSGFERLYARVTKLYFGGMARHLAELRTGLRPGAQLAYVVGDQASYLRVLIRTGQLLAEIAGSLGYEVVGIDLFRTRRATTTGEQLREEVVVLRWPG